MKYRTESLLFLTFRSGAARQQISRLSTCDFVDRLIFKNFRKPSGLKIVNDYSVLLLLLFFSRCKTAALKR